MRACVICDGPLPPGSPRHHFERAACDNPECRRAMLAWSSSHRPVVRRVRQEAIRGERTCEGCDQTKPLDGEHFPISAKRDDQVWYRRLCLVCWRSGPAAAARAKYRAKVAADPARRARMLEDARIRAALRREQETGRLASTNARNRNVPNAFREDTGGGGVDPRPILAWLHAVIAREVPDHGRRGGDNDRNDRGRTMGDLAAELGLPPRRIWSILTGEQAHVAFSTVDKCVTNYAGAVGGEDMAAALEARCRAMPGNGERLLRYIDGAEAFAHLSDATVWRAADLYPEMAS